MNRAEYLGAWMVILMRRKQEAYDMFWRCDSELTDIRKQIEEMDPGDLYRSAGSLPPLDPDAPAPVSFGSRSLASADTTSTMPAVTPCPNSQGKYPSCPEPCPHVHYADGSIGKRMVNGRAQ